MHPAIYSPEWPRNSEIAPEVILLKEVSNTLPAGKVSVEEGMTHWRPAKQAKLSKYQYNKYGASPTAPKTLSREYLSAGYSGLGVPPSGP